VWIWRSLPLQTVFQISQELASRRQPRILQGGEKPLIRRRKVRTSCLRAAATARAAMQALQALHQKLDIADGSGCSFTFSPPGTRFIGLQLSLIRGRVSLTAPTPENGVLW